MNIENLKDYGALGGMVIVVISSVSSFFWRNKRYGEEIRGHDTAIRKLNGAMFPSKPELRPLTLGWHDRIQEDCEKQRTKDMEILAGHIVGSITKELEPIREQLARLNERTGGR